MSHKVLFLVTTSILLINYITLINSERILKQSFCLFRHGSRLPNTKALIDIFESNEDISDMTDNGEEQLKTLAEYYQDKLFDNYELLSGDYEDDDGYIYFRCTRAPNPGIRVSQAMNVLVRNLYPDEYVGIINVPLGIDDNTSSDNCRSLAFENQYFRNYQSNYYLNLLFNTSTRQDLINNVLNTTNFNANYVLGLDDQIECLAEENLHAIENNPIWKTLIKYEKEIDLYKRYDGVIPYLNGYLDGTYGTGYELFKFILDQMYKQVNPNYEISSLCYNGPCKLLLYSTSATNMRTLMHQLGLLTIDSLFVYSEAGTSICFDLFYDDNNDNYSLDILYGQPQVKNNNKHSNKKYKYTESFMQDVVNTNDSTTKQDSFIKYACNNYPYSSNCNITKIMQYLNNRKPTYLVNDCCSRASNVRVSTIFNSVYGCNDYLKNNSQINSNCVTWRYVCPQSACDTNQVYSPALQKCVSTTC